MAQYLAKFNAHFCAGAEVDLLGQRKLVG